MQEKDGFVSKAIMSDNADFHLSGNINKQNLRFYDEEDLHEMYEELLHPLKVTA